MKVTTAYVFPPEDLLSTLPNQAETGRPRLAWVRLPATTAAFVAWPGDAPEVSELDPQHLKEALHTLQRALGTMPVLLALAPEPAAVENRMRGGLAPWQLKRAQEVLLSNLAGRLCLKRVADACRVSPRHFSRAFTRDTGLSPQRWLMRERLVRAQALLRDEPGLAIAEIALRCGFTDQSHLTRAFSAQYGSTPANWRRQDRHERGRQCPD